jgi:hypothetical protein
LELALVGAAEARADGDFVLGGDEVVDVCVEVGERTAHELGAALGQIDQPSG